VGVRLVESARMLRRWVRAARRPRGRGRVGLRHLRSARRGAAALAALSLALAGCAAVPASERDPRDPWQRVNRATFSVDYRFYTDVGEPVAKTYVRVVPGPIRDWVSNFFNNLSYPTVIVNDVLQGRMAAFGRDSARLAIDTTFGIGGLLDPATGIGLVRDQRDFGQTFGKWGCPSGPYLVLPLLGPSDLRDAIGLVPAQFTDPLAYVNNAAADYAVRGAGALNTGAALLPELKLDREAYDHYAFARDTYLSRRAFMVRGDRGKEAAKRELEELEPTGGSRASSSSNPPGPDSAQSHLACAVLAPEVGDELTGALDRPDGMVLNY
jgi:phospholipid-binding lipoprotein MlaA